MKGQCKRNFSDYITPDQALEDGDIDIAVYQHQPFLDNFNKQKGAHLVSIGKAILMRMGIYSNKYKSVDEIPDGTVIAIPNDPTNGGRGLLLLQEAGLIKLKDGVGSKATVTDVTENPKHLQFQELDAAQLPRSLDDVGAAVITMNYVMSAGLDPKKQGIFLEPKDAPLAVMIIASREKDKDNPAYKTLSKLISLMLSVNSLPTNTRELLNRHSDRFRRRETGNNLSLFYFAIFHGKAYDGK